MSRPLPFDHHRWGNRLVVNRSLDIWREYGAATAIFELQKEWSRFLFRRDARDLALVPKRVAALANKIFDHEMLDGIPISGHDMWQKYRDERGVSSREKNAWLEAFTEAYTGQIEEYISDLIPKELDGKLEIFCSLVSAVATHAEAGHDPDDFGITLGRKMPEIVKYHPRKALIIQEAKREGTSEAKLHWGWQMGPNPHMIRYMRFIHPPQEWIVNASEEDLYEHVYTDSYFKLLRKNIEKLIPAKAWKNAFLICSLFDEMEAQKNIGRKDSSQKGWNYIRSQREHDLYMTEERRREEQEIYEGRQQRKTPSPTMGVLDIRPQFSSAHVSITAGAQAAFEESGEQPKKYLDRHCSGDFGEVTGDDAALNQSNMTTNNMVMSIYRLSTGVRFYIITDAGHMTSTILLREEY